MRKGGKRAAQRTRQRIAAIQPYESESEEEERRSDESNKSSMDRPGAITVLGMGRSGMGASPDDEEETIIYSMGGSNRRNNNDETAAQAEEDGNHNLLPSSRNGDINNEEHLVEAELVPEPPKTVEGTPMEEMRGREMNTYIALGVLLVVIVGLVVAIVLGFYDPDPETLETTTPIPPSPQTLPPTPGQTTLTEMAISMLSPFIPDVPSSPMQQQALNWLVENDGEGLITVDDDDGCLLLERYTLAILYFSTNGTEWIRNDDWLSGLSVCLWWNTYNHAICDENNRVNRINLDCNNLVGTIPTEIGLLTRLESLQLDENLLVGSIPTEFGQLTALTSLSLSSNNELVGSIPTELGQLTALTSLSLSSNNELVGSIPTELGQLTSLKWSYIYSNNELVGTIPTELGQLTDLYGLLLYCNKLTGMIPTELIHLKKLTWLELNKFEDEMR